MKALVILLILILMSCVTMETPPPKHNLIAEESIRFTRQGFEQNQFERDSKECKYDIEKTLGPITSFNRTANGVIFEASMRIKRKALFESCMEARGYNLLK